MKMKIEHQRRLKRACLRACKFRGVSGTFKLYRDASLIPGGHLHGKNHEMICRWDIFHCAMKHDTELLGDLYAYLYDDHIRTALKKFLRPDQ